MLNTSVEINVAEYCAQLGWDSGEFKETIRAALTAGILRLSDGRLTMGTVPRSGTVDLRERPKEKHDGEEKKSGAMVGLTEKEKEVVYLEEM